MKINMLLIIAAAVLTISASAAQAGQTINEEGSMACVTDKWDEKEIAKNHKVADASTRCVYLPDDPAAPKATEECKGKYEYLPDGTWKAAGTCTDTFKGGDKLFVTYEEGSHLTEYTFKKTGGTGKYEGATGGGTYMYENLTDTLAGGRYKGTVVLP